MGIKRKKGNFEAVPGLEIGMGTQALGSFNKFYLFSSAGACF
jgi:hypothetical protein